MAWKSGDPGSGPRVAPERDGGGGGRGTDKVLRSSLRGHSPQRLNLVISQLPVNLKCVCVCEDSMNFHTHVCLKDIQRHREICYGFFE